MMYIPKTRLEEFRRGIEAWKQFKQLSQQLARHNAQTLKQKGVQGAMMGQKHFTPKLFHSLSLSKLVPDGHLVRSLEEVLDLGFVRKLWCAV